MLTAYFRPAAVASPTDSLRSAQNVAGSWIHSSAAGRARTGSKMPTPVPCYGSARYLIAEATPVTAKLEQLQDLVRSNS